jgi:hypothetical protein
MQNEGGLTSLECRFGTPAFVLSFSSRAHTCGIDETDSSMPQVWTFMEK